MKIRVFIPVAPALPALNFKHALMDQFNGFTVYPAQGQWRMPDGNVADEPVEVLEVLAPQKYFHDVHTWLQRECLRYGIAAQQDSVMFALNDEPYLVSPEKAGEYFAFDELFASMVD